MEFGRKQRSCHVVIAMFMLCLCLANCSKLKQIRKQKKSTCDVYQGSWVYDESFPLYNSSACPFIRQEFDCFKYGRPDHLYLEYRWQPTECDLPRFDGQDFLRKLKGKKIMFIGDSVSLNQYESLLCLLHAAVPNSNIRQDKNATFPTVIFEDYDVSIMLFHTLLLVDVEQELVGRVLKLDSLKNGEIWKDMDVLVFNTWLWWYRRGPKQPWDYVEDGENILKDIDRMDAFRKALTTWAKWVDSDVDTSKTRVIFQGISPSHYNGSEWNKPGVTNCSNETQPISGSSYSRGSPLALSVLEDVLSRIKKPVHLLNITTLSQLRKDAHPGPFNGLKGMDCTHWCIAGLPDTWNNLLYSFLTT
ncbi:protein trichome birefringence-like 38 [Mercurialis annua]|uniref:protein trichome birefringence-like 38 n=1 Tax=Mercurialis annua TaxID=3986 RepID=UPI0021605DDE|nr:protein trichome birefringence-like 38 [Mercurialis annua]